MYDWIVVGGGSAGCVLAARLSQNPIHRVLLLEAGRDTAAASEALIRARYPGYAYFNPDNIWTGLTALGGNADRNDAAARPRIPYAQARLLGGGSAINGLGANRGSPADYAEWVAAGAAGWGWDDVLPVFRAIEDAGDSDDAPEWHGSGGPIPIRRVPETDMSPYVAGVEAALLARGFGKGHDQNGAWDDGVFPIKLNIDGTGRRVTVADAYLTAAVRTRPNLTIRTGVSVASILMEGNRSGGVVLQDGQRIAALNVAVAAGAIHTPALLMRSGIGDGEALRRLGIPVAVHRPGIGQNLMEHPYAAVMATLPRASRLPADAYHIPRFARYSSGLAQTPTGDMHLAVIGRPAWHGIGRRLGMVGVWVNKAFSRGQVRLTAPDPTVHPEIDFRLLSDHRDLERLAAGIRLAAGLVQTTHRQGLNGAPMPARMSDRARKYGAATLRNRLSTEAFGLLTDLLGGAGEALLRRAVDPGIALDALLADDGALHGFLQESTIGVWHASGTCRMGRPDDPLAVVDPQGRLIGAEGLHIADASVFPTIPCANTNIPVVMVAERMAAFWCGCDGIS